MKRLIVALSALLMLTASCSSATSGESEPVPLTPEPAPSRPAAHIGETLDLMRIGQQKISVTLEGIINPATVPHGWGEPDKTYVATRLKIANTGTTTIVGNSNSNVSVIGSDGHDYRADFATVTECQDFVYGWFLLAVGDSKTGCVVFKLPQGVTPAKVKYTPSSGISRDVGEWLNS